jgi:hypothetical protein
MWRARQVPAQKVARICVEKGGERMIAGFPALALSGLRECRSQTREHPGEHLAKERADNRHRQPPDQQLPEQVSRDVPDP